MKATIIIGVLLCVSVLVLSRKPDPALQPYPLVFTAVYNESDPAVYWQAPRMRTAYLDAPNKRASISYNSEKGQTESWTLIYRPKGADPNSPASQGYTGFNINPDFPDNVPNDCYYTTGPLISIAPFPPHWNRYGDTYSVAIDAWFNLPNDLIYAGQYFIPELGVTSDRWDTVSQCVLEKSGIGKVPCTSVMYSQGEDPLPLMDIRAYGASKNGSETDSYAIRVYHSFITSVDDSNFALPNDWEVNCGNADNDFVTDPDTDLLVCDGDNNAISIQLAAPPVPGLGDVKVYLTPDPTSYYTCVECLDFEEDYLIFTSDNWDEPQQFPIDYSCTGCSQYLISAYGGGYDWTYSERTIVVYTNKKEKLGNCVATPICSYHYNCGHHIGKSLNTNV